MESSPYRPRPDLVQLWIVSSVIAVACHHFIFRRVELDEKAAALVFIFLVTCVAILVLDISLQSASFVSSLCRLAVATASFATTSAISILVYRAFFHRLNRFPGPFLARLTKLYAFKQSQSLQYYKELEDMHRKYGDVVRTGKLLKRFQLRSSPITGKKGLVSCP
ncbi:Cytochrome P450 [Macrophomina phaseolina MS6]|uniref:Cytochrome P450 n=1 Tax=Macrophomina phaseolina (strain MS6) TaxID=1126212 RepID=K2RXH0_MACPH|nr:Cytochrome P450 [Macrophomina phaseolina MS6]